MVLIVCMGLAACGNKGNDGRNPDIGKNGTLKITYYKGGKRADGADIIPNDAPEIMQLLSTLWATGCTRKVAEGVLSAQSIWGEDLNAISGLTDAVTACLDSIQEKGMLETVKTIL